MPSTFLHAKPLQALKLGAVLGVLLFGIAAVAGLLGGRGLDGLLYLAFFPMLLAVVVGGEALAAGYRLARSDEPVARLTARRGYTAIRVTEVVLAVGAPGMFYVLIVEIGSEVAGPGAIGLLFIGLALGGVAFGAVLLRTLVEYYYYRQERSSSRHLERGSGTVE